MGAPSWVEQQSISVGAVSVVTPLSWAGGTPPLATPTHGRHEWSRDARRKPCGVRRPGLHCLPSSPWRRSVHEHRRADANDPKQSLDVPRQHAKHPSDT
jgi:hypothetical protein